MILVKIIFSIDTSIIPSDASLRGKAKLHSVNAEKVAFLVPLKLVFFPHAFL